MRRFLTILALILLCWIIPSLSSAQSDASLTGTWGIHGGGVSLGAEGFGTVRQWDCLVHVRLIDLGPDAAVGIPIDTEWSPRSPDVQPYACWPEDWDRVNFLRLPFGLLLVDHTIGTPSITMHRCVLTSAETDATAPPDLRRAYPSCS